MNIPLTPLRFFERARRLFRDKVGVIGKDRTWTYDAYAGRCHQLANLLKESDLSAGGRVAFLAYNSHELLEAYYGVPLASGILLPLNIRLRPNDFRYILNDAGAEFLFVDPDFWPLIEEIRLDLPSIRRFIMLGSSRTGSTRGADHYETMIGRQSTESSIDLLEVDEHSVAELFYTSGTTGNPKGVMLTHRNLFLHALEAAMATEARESDVHLHTIPLFHVNGWGTPQFLTCVGGTHVLLDRFNPEHVLRLVEEHGVTTFSMVPTMAIALVNHRDALRRDCSSLRLITLGGAAANPTLVRQIEETFGCPCIAGYGMTETSPVLTLSVTRSDRPLSTSEKHRVQSMTGLPIPAVEIEIVNEEDEFLPWDGQSIGEIVVRGDGVMKGYWKQPDETTHHMRNGWFHTGDMATIDSDGYLLIVDRKKDIIISGGENISSLEVEKVLISHASVLECAVIPVPDAVWGEVPLGLVVLKDEEEISQDELVDFCRSRLAHFKCPNRIEFLESLPKGGTGKILKQELRQVYRNS